MNKVLDLWETCCIGKTNVIYERNKFNDSSQEQAESIDTYVTAPRALAETYEFGSLKDHLIRDNAVCDNAVRIIARIGVEATSVQLKQNMAPSQQSSKVDLVRKGKSKKASTH